ncbi:MAG: hypothetical protein A2Z88_07190 [Omnitrophica WOR_2 bacterium GWA2_47_8]|nr:MAG: hypothetical protein A2Z88_07190 [Omnitrophica WOR_2 bacterium GWA2_47_8]
MADTNLADYLAAIRVCDDQFRLKEVHGIYDNWPVLLYGNRNEVFDKVAQAFRESAQERGIRDSWIEYEAAERNRLVFEYESGTVLAQIQGRTHAMYSKEEDRIQGSTHSVFVMFHAHPDKEGQDGWDFKAISSAIAGFGDYIIMERFTARFPRANPKINHIPG